MHISSQLSVSRQSVIQWLWSAADLRQCHSLQSLSCQYTGRRSPPDNHSRLPCTLRHRWDDQEHTSHSVQTAGTLSTECEWYMTLDITDSTWPLWGHTHRTDKRVAGTLTTCTTHNTHRILPLLTYCNCTSLFLYTSLCQMFTDFQNLSPADSIIFPSVLWHCWLGDRKGIRPVKHWVLICWWWQYGWSFAHLMAPVVTITSIVLSFNKTV